MTRDTNDAGIGHSVRSHAAQLTHDRWGTIAASVLSEPQPLPALHVANTPMTDAMGTLPPASRLDIGDHFDWLLAASAEGLALIDLHLLRPRASTVEWTVPWKDLEVEVTEHGALERTQVIVVTDGDKGWAAFGARVSSRRKDRISAFVSLLEARANETDPGT